MNTKNIFIAAVAILGIALTSCKKDEPQSPSNPTTAPAQSFKVRMTDAPGDYQGLYVEIDKVEAYLDGSGWISLSSTSQMVSVLDLTNGNEVTLATQSDAKAGVYSKIRLTFGDQNTIKLNSSSDIGLQLGNGMSATGSVNLDVLATLGQERTVVILIDEQVSSSAGASVLLDFNVAASIIEDVNGWRMNPIIIAIKDQTTGVKGTISGAVQANITISKAGYSSNTNMAANGGFMFRGLEEGTYTVVIDAEVQGQSTNQIKTITGVTVVRGSIEDMGTIQL